MVMEGSEDSGEFGLKAVWLGSSVASTELQLSSTMVLFDPHSIVEVDNVSFPFRKRATQSLVQFSLRKKEGLEWGPMFSLQALSPFSCSQKL